MKRQGWIVVEEQVARRRIQWQAAGQGLRVQRVPAFIEIKWRLHGHGQAQTHQLGQAQHQEDQRQRPWLHKPEHGGFHGRRTRLRHNTRSEITNFHITSMAMPARAASAAQPLNWSYAHLATDTLATRPTEQTAR
jgi:hypothetical protein